MSLGATADELTTRLHPLTRSAVAGIANRNGIKFSSKKPPGAFRNRPKKDRRTMKLDPLLAKLKKSTTPEKPRPNFVTERVRAHVRPPRANCSWAGCAAHAEEGGMFCFSHGRKGLIA